MDKYKDGAKKRFKPKMDHRTGEYKVNPFMDSQQALTRATFSKRERDEFFTEAYADILCDLFVQWLRTEPHCQKEREYLYHVAMGLGSVKERLIQIETFGFNQESMLKSQEENEQNVGT